MKLGSKWRSVLMKAWSVRLMILAAVLSGLEAAVTLAGNFLDLPKGLFALLAFFATCAAFIARFIVQKDMDGD